jgi:hypothetical protein
MLHKFMTYTCSDFFIYDQKSVGPWAAIKNSLTVNAIYSSWKKFDWPDTYFLLNLNWPSDLLIDQIPDNFERYIISFQIEAIDIYWVKKLADKFKDRQIFVVHEGKSYNSDWWPDNLTFISWITWDDQLRRIASVHGRQDFVNTATRKITSLCSRTSQFKYYATGYMLKNYYNDTTLISYHRQVSKQSDTDHLITNIPALDEIVEFMSYQNPVLIDTTDQQKRNTHMLNTDWHHRGHTDSVFCLTNEGYHYSYSVIDGTEIIHPGPPLSEKTFKPILAGQAIIMVGQANSLSSLSKLGFNFDYGLDYSYDAEFKDLTRIQMIFKVIDKIMSMSIEELKKSTKEICTHNSNWAVSDGLKKITSSLNEKSLEELRKKMFT